VFTAPAVFGLKWSGNYPVSVLPWPDWRINANGIYWRYGYRLFR
jgi:hypothetical protein